MSHDRGCSCGREPYEYDDCIDPNCLKRKTKMEDTDWRPSPCPHCGMTREAARHPVCTNPNCLKKEDKMDSDDWHKAHGLAEPGTKAYGERTVKTEKQYLWVKAGRAPTFVTDLIELYKDCDFDPNEDTIYELGPEVKLNLTVKVTPTKPVYRENASGYRVPFENRD